MTTAEQHQERADYFEYMALEYVTRFGPLPDMPLNPVEELSMAVAALRRVPTKHDEQRRYVQTAIANTQFALDVEINDA